MREYRYEQALRVLSSLDSEEAAVLRFAIYRHQERLHDAATLLKTIDVRTVSTMNSFDQVQFYSSRGILESNRSNHELAEKNYREAIRRAEEADDKIVAKLSLARILLFEKNQADDETKKLFEEAAVLLPEAKYPSTLCHYLLEQARLLQRSGLNESKAALYFAALALSEKAELPLVSARCYRVLAQYFKSRREHQKACQYQREAIRTCLAEEEWEQSIRYLASLAYLVEETAEGRDFYKSELLHALNAKLPQTYRLQLYVLLSRMDGDQAEYWARKGLEESGGFPDERIMLLKALATQMEGSASTAELLQIYRQAESIARPRSYRDYPAFDSGLGQVRHDMAEALLREHRYREALEMLDKAAEAEQEPGRRWHLNFILNRAGDTALRLGDLASARAYFQRSVEQIKAEKDETQRSVLAAGLFYIHTYTALLEGMESDPSSLVLGISPLAEELLRSELSDEETYQLFLDIFNRDIERERQSNGSGGSSLRYRGILYEAADRREEARRAYLAAFENSGGYNRHADLIDRLCLARLAYKDGGWNAARDELRKSLNLAQDIADGDYFKIALGWAELELEENQAALEMFRRVESDRSKPLAYYGMARALIGLEQYQEALRSINDALASELGLSLALKGRLYSARGEAERLSGRVEQSRQDYLLAIEALATTRQWASLLEAYMGLGTTLARLGLDSEAAEVYGQATTILESVRDQIEPGKLSSAGLSELATGSVHQPSKIGRTVVNDRQGFLLLQERLKRTYPQRFEFSSPYTASQLFSLRDQMPDDSALILVQSFSAETYVTVLTGTDLITREVGLGRAELVSLSEELQESLPRGGDVAVQRQRKLYELLLKPLEDHLGGKTRWRFLPTPEIQSLPLGALVDSQGTTLSQERIVSILPKNPEGASSPSRTTEDTGILLLGAPTGQNLKGVKRELLQLGARFPKSSLLIGEDATTASFLREIGKYSIVHISSHASSRGIELSDKYLSLTEIFETPLASGTLVVLSACETARSEGHASSLAEAFQVAGATAVIASLWKVDDLATAELFGHFYTHLKRGHPTDAALTLAQRKMQEDERWKNAFYWSGFVLVEAPPR